MKHKLGIKIARRNINNLRYADDTTLTVESEEELKSLLMKVKEESEEVQDPDRDQQGVHEAESRLDSRTAVRGRCHSAK